MAGRQISIASSHVPATFDMHLSVHKYQTLHRPSDNVRVPACLRGSSLRNWEWRDVYTDDGETTIGCFATVRIPRGHQLHPRMELHGRKLIAAQVEMLRAAKQDADVMLVATDEAHIVGINGGERGAHSIRLPLTRSTNGDFIVQRFRANCTFSDGNIRLITSVSAGVELFMQTDKLREVAVLRSLNARAHHGSNALVLVAEDVPGLPRATKPFPRYTIREAHEIKEWADENGNVLYVFSSLCDCPKVRNPRSTSDVEIEMASIIHWESGEKRKYKRTFTEPPSEYVEISDDTQNKVSGQPPTQHSIFIVHPGHLTEKGSRYEATRRAFGNYSVVSANKPAVELGIRRALIDRLLTPRETPGQISSYTKFACHLNAQLEHGNVVVHCCSSRSRSPTLVAVWMMQHRGYTLAAVTQILTERYEDQRPTVTAKSVDCPNLPRFQLLLWQIEQLCADESGSDESNDDAENTDASMDLHNGLDHRYADDTADDSGSDESNDAENTDASMGLHNGLDHRDDSEEAADDRRLTWVNHTAVGNVTSGASDDVGDDSSSDSSSGSDTDMYMYSLDTIERAVVRILSARWEDIRAARNDCRAACVKHMLYMDGYADLFDRCAGDMLNFIQSLIDAHEAGQNSGSDAAEHTDDAEHTASAEHTSGAAGNVTRSTSDDIGDDSSSDDAQQSPPRKTARRAIVSSGADELQNPATDAGSATTDVPKPCEWPKCGSTDRLEQQAGVWVCGEHVMRPRCALGTHCMCHKYGAFQARRCKTGSRKVGRKCDLPRWATLYQITDELRQKVYCTLGQHSLPSRSQFICGRCRDKLVRLKRQESTDTAIDDSFLEYAKKHRHGPWLQYKRMHRREEVALKERAAAVMNQKASAAANADKIQQLQDTVERLRNESERRLQASKKLTSALAKKRSRLKEQDEKIGSMKSALEAAQSQRALSASNEVRVRVEQADAAFRRKLLHESESMASLTADLKAMAHQRTKLARTLESTQRQAKSTSDTQKLQIQKLESQIGTMERTMESRLAEQTVATKKLRAKLETLRNNLHGAKLETARFKTAAERAAEQAAAEAKKVEYRQYRRRGETLEDLLAQLDQLPLRAASSGQSSSDHKVLQAKRLKLQRTVNRRMRPFIATASSMLNLAAWPPSIKVLTKLGVRVPSADFSADEYHQMERDLDKARRQNQYQQVQLHEAFELMQQASVQTSGRTTGNHVDLNLDMNIAGGVSKRQAASQRKVLQGHGIECDLKQYRLHQAKKVRRWRLPLHFTFLTRQQCKSFSCRCWVGAGNEASQVRSVSMSQAEDLRRLQVRTFIQCYRNIARLLDVDEASMERIMEAIVRHLSAAPTARLEGRTQTSIGFSNTTIPEPYHEWKPFERALARYVASRCPRAVGIDVVEARDWNVTQLEKMKQTKRLFFASSSLENIGDDWCTAEVMRDCQAYKTLNRTNTVDSKSALVMSFCFDGVAAGKDFQLPYQQHSWRFANLRSAGVDDVWLTHMCAIKETKTCMQPVHRSVHARLSRPDARFVECDSVQRPAHYIGVSDCKAMWQVLGGAGNSSKYSCFKCTQCVDHMYDLEHCRFTVLDKETDLQSYIQLHRGANLEIEKRRKELQKLRSEMGEPRSPSQMELSARRIAKFVETCCIVDAINGSLSVCNVTKVANAKELEQAILKHRETMKCARRLACAKVVNHYLLRGVTDCSEILITHLNMCTVGHRPIPTGVQKRLAEVTKLCRAAGPLRMRGLCSVCQPSVQKLCSKCAHICDREWADTRERGYPGLPLWETIPPEQYFDEENAHHQKLLDLANGSLMSGKSNQKLAKVHFSDPDNACVDGWEEGQGYCTWGQIGDATLKSIPDVYLAADLLHTMKDVQYTLIQANIAFAKACNVIENLGNVLVRIGLKFFASGALKDIKVKGRLNPTRDGLNGPQSDFYYRSIDCILNAT